MKKIMFNDKFCLTQAVLGGSKTMTRRKLKIPKACNGTEVYGFNVLTNSLGTQCVDLIDYGGNVLGSWKPHYEVGEVVAIAQSYKDIDLHDIIGYKAYGQNMYEPIYAELSAGWNNKMFVKSEIMPCHIRITDIRVERLQDISDEDCLREGVWQFYDNKKLFYISKNTGEASTVCFLSAREAFAYLIDKVSGKGTWESNPWVAAYSFELVD